jgi:shikimate dehydrogenase
MYKFAVIGSPIVHSLSPQIHAAFFEKTGLKGTYEKREVPPDQLRQGVIALMREGFNGWNITLPHKEGMLSLCSQVNNQAKQIGAVNTVKSFDGALYGFNTDADGWWKSIEGNLSATPKTALVLGAGGAARAIIQSLTSRNVKVTIANRTLERAQNLAAHFGADAITMDAANDHLENCDVLVNTTSVGLHAGDELPVEFAKLPAHALVSDLIYRNTNFLREASAHKLATVNGLGMLLGQARLAFTIWTGVDPGIPDDLRETLEAKI